MEENINSKKSNGKNAIIVILVILLLCAVGYIVYDKVLTKKEEAPVKTEKKEEVKPEENLDEISAVLEKKISDYNIDQLDVYEKKATFNGTPTNEQLMAMLYYFWDKDTNKNLSEDLNLTKTEVDNYFKEIYGIAPTSYPDIICVLDNKPLYKYDSNKSGYVAYKEGNIPTHGHGSDYVKVINKIIAGITKENDDYVLTLTKLYAAPMTSGASGHYYSDATYKSIINDFDQFIDKNSGQGNDDLASDYFINNKDKFKNLKPQYKYTFKKDNNDYYLAGYEVIK